MKTSDNLSATAKEWADRLEEGRADIAAGRTFDGEAVLAELRAEDEALLNSGARRRSKVRS